MKRKSLLFLCSFLSAFAIGAQPLNHVYYRTIDGTANNQQNPTWGAAGAQLLRFSGTAYADGISAPTGVNRPNPRAISNMIFAQGNFMPAPQGLSDYMWVWGQFIDHDFGLTPDINETLHIPIPSGDVHFDPFGTGQVSIPVHRNLFDVTTGTGIANPRQHINIISSYIDASFVYGDRNARAAWLRTFTGGKLKVSEGNLLPYNTLNGEFWGEIDANAPAMANPVGLSNKFFVAGDERANENPLLAGLHTLFVREHNRMCDELAKQHPDWSDERLYQHARKYVGGFVQAVTYREWLPQLGVNVPAYTGYKPNVNATLANEFTAAAFRLGHTLLNGNLQRLYNNGESLEEGPVALRDAFFNPFAIVTTPGGLDPFFKGMAVQTMQQFDAKVIDDVRNFLFGPPGAGGLDLVAINILRGRERGLPDFNTIRAAYGLTPYSSFPQINSSSQVFSALHELYGDINNIDPWVGFVAEQQNSPQTVVGPTLQRILQVQFTALRDGDRFYYENDPVLTDEEKDIIRNTKLRDIVVRNSGLPMLQDNVFKAMPHSEICDNMHVRIYGRFRSVLDAPVPGVQLAVQMTGNDLDGQSDAFGAYDFNDVKGCDVQGFTVSKNDPASTGVSTLDIILIQRHILGSELLDSPYKLLAADVNRSGSISTLDIVLMRRVILGIATEFPDGNVWRFIPTAHSFSDPANPFADNIIEPPMHFDLMALNYNGDFVAVKAGDVNGSAVSGFHEDEVELRQLAALRTLDQSFRRGEQLAIPVFCNEISGLSGIQIEWSYGSELELTDIEVHGNSGLSREHFGRFATEGVLTMSWNQSDLSEALANGAWFTLHFTALKDGQLSETLRQSDTKTPSEAYTKGLETRHLLWYFDTDSNAAAAGFELYQNRPNPVADATLIPFLMPESGQVRLSIVDVAGRVLFTADRHAEKGYNEWQLERAQLSASGLVLYRMQTPHGTLTRKMLLAD
ncbi:MAG TPA: peroxidase family protein [Saprospiraceae bacterium]|jgi:hypothetical protein|nr:peroxidase family protein [Saprospiraceae bacterium]